MLQALETLGASVRQPGPRHEASAVPGIEHALGLPATTRWNINSYRATCQTRGSDCRRRGREVPQLPPQALGRRSTTPSTHGIPQRALHGIEEVVAIPGLFAPLPRICPSRPGPCPTHCGGAAGGSSAPALVGVCGPTPPHAHQRPTGRQALLRISHTKLPDQPWSTPCISGRSGLRPGIPLHPQRAR